MTLELERAGFPSLSVCGMIYIHLYRHLEQFIKDSSMKLSGINPATNNPYPDWLQAAARKAYDKLDKYYPATDGLCYIIATGS